MLETVSILSIGYGNRSIGDFIELLKKYEVELLVDVRSYPFSRYNPDYRKNLFIQHLSSAGIQFLFLGGALGGKPAAKHLYSPEGRLDYSKVYQWEAFQLGLKSLITKASKQNVAIMCAELDPAACHRKTLIAPPLEEQGIEVRHIGKQGELVQELF